MATCLTQAVTVVYWDVFVGVSISNRVARHSSSNSASTAISAELSGRPPVELCLPIVNYAVKKVGWKREMRVQVTVNRLNVKYREIWTMKIGFKPPKI